MPLITSLIDRLAVDFPQFRFMPGEAFRWAPREMTIYHQINSFDTAALFHELSHAILNHRQFTRDVQLMEYEQAAWYYAKDVLAPHYHVHITADQIEEALDTYRDWLHARSRCPQCDATGLQTKAQLYSCLSCHTTWRVNDARVCRLKRTVIPNQNTPQ